jgi:excisionase family DNA binding protein
VDDNFTPKQVAQALQVSESSVKRWCDRGLIRTDRTVGGHRRIPLDNLLEFLESTNRRVLDPAAIGLTVQSRQAEEPVVSKTAPAAESSALREAFEVCIEWWYGFRG